MREESVYIGKEFNSNRITLVYQHVLRFIVSEVKMPCSCYLKAKRFKVVFVNKIIYQVLVIKARCPLSRIPYVPKEQAGHDWCRFTRFVQNMLSTLFIREILESHGVCLR